MKPLLVFAFTLLVICSLPAQISQRRHAAVTWLNANQRELYTRSMELATEDFDPNSHLLRRLAQGNGSAAGFWCVSPAGTHSAS